VDLDGVIGHAKFVVAIVHLDLITKFSGHTYDAIRIVAALLLNATDARRHPTLSMLVAAAAEFRRMHCQDTFATCPSQRTHVLVRHQGIWQEILSSLSHKANAKVNLITACVSRDE